MQKIPQNAPGKSGGLFFFVVMIGLSSASDVVASGDESSGGYLVQLAISFGLGALFAFRGTLRTLASKSISFFNAKRTQFTAGLVEGIVGIRKGRVSNVS
jgi:hypothetical protein